MTEHDETPEDEVEVEAHGLKEAAAGISAAALLAAGAGAANAATGARATSNANPAAHPTQKLQKKTDATIKATNKLEKKDATFKGERAGVRVNPSATDKV